jgi:hypothetical protein
MSSSNLVFHNLLELLSIISTIGSFVLVWKSRKFLNNAYLVVIGIALFSVGLLEIAHALTNNMKAYQGYDDHNLHIQLWVAARYVENVSFLVAPFLIGRRINFAGTVTFYLLLTAFLFGAIFYWRFFPDCYIEASGLTNFEMESEYALSQMLVASIGLLLWRFSYFNRRVLLLLGAAMVSSMSSEISFSPYMRDYRFPGIAGHIFMGISYVLILLAIGLASRLAHGHRYQEEAAASSING